MQEKRAHSKGNLDAPARVPASIALARRFAASAENTLVIREYEMAHIAAYNSAFHAGRALLFSRGFVERSHACLTVALLHLYHGASIWYHKGWALSKLQKHEEAVRAYCRSLECDPDALPSWVNLGTSLNILGRFGEALDAGDLALALDSGDAHAWNMKGDAQMGMERYEEALEAYNKALSIDPEHAHAWYSKGVALKRLRPADTP
ncbi:MAG TPA: tetratricopeptide repeat protein [Methanoculleus sp.]|nr:tetratricopeptide repeat protein [Methanoculleus sp.]